MNKEWKGNENTYRATCYVLELSHCFRLVHAITTMLILTAILTVLSLFIGPIPQT